MPRLKSLRFNGGEFLCTSHVLLLFIVSLLSFSPSIAQCEADAGNPITICSGQSVELGGNPTAVDPNNASNVNYSWVVGAGAPFSSDANPTVQPTATTTYTVNLSGGGCNNETDNITVTVIPAGFVVTASANTSSNPITICAGSSLDLSSSVVGVPAGQNGNVLYSWNGPNGYSSSIGNPLPFNANANAGGTYTVTASIGDCDVTDNVTVNVIAASINNTLNGQNILVYCLQAGETSGEVGFLINLPSSLGSVSYYQVNWDDGSPVQQVSATTSPSWSDLLLHTYGVGVYSAQLTVYLTNGCTHTTSATAFVGSSPSPANLSLFAGQSSGCAPHTTQFDFLVPNTNVEGTTYTINWGDGSPEEVYTHPNTPAVLTHVYQNSSCGATNIFNTPNAYSATVTTQNPCALPQQSGSSQIFVGDPPTSDFNLSAQTVCVGELVNTINNSDAGVTFSASSTSCQTTAPGCWTIASPAGANPTISSGTLGNCSSANFAFWTPGSTNIGATFSQAGSYTYSYRIKNSCGEDIETETLCVIPPPTCDFTLTPPSGCSVLTVGTLNNSDPPECNSVPLELNYIWTVTASNGCTNCYTISDENAENPTFTFTNNTSSNITFTVELEVAPINPQTNAVMSCSTTCTETVVVFPSPQFLPTSTTQTNCGPFNPTSFTINIQGGPANPEFQWYSTIIQANPGSLANPGMALTGNGANTQTYDPPGNIAVTTYYFCVVSYQNIPNCTSFQSPLFQAIVYPVPSVNAGADQTICSTGTANLSATGNGGTAPLNYAWTPVASLSNASIANPVANPSSTTTYNVIVTDDNGCTATDGVIINVSPAATATVADVNTCIGIPVNVNATSSGAGFWVANPSGAGSFLDVNDNSTVFSPLSNTTLPVTITWTTNDPDGVGPNGPCLSVSDVGTITIIPPPQASFSNDFEVCSNGSVALSVNTNTAGSWSASPNNLGTIVNGNSANATFTAFANISGLVNLTWTTVDPGDPCNAVSADTTLVIYSAATANAGGPYETCGTDSVEIDAVASGPGSWSVSPPNSGTFVNANLASTSFIPASAAGGIITLTWTTSDPDNITGGSNGPCQSVASSASLQVFAPPSATVTDYTACEGVAVNLQAISTPAAGQWTSIGGGTFSTNPATTQSIAFTPPLDIVSVEVVWTTADPVGPCNAASDTGTVAINNSIEGFITPLVYSTCGTESVDVGVTSSNSGSWSTSPIGGGTFLLPSSNLTTFTPNSGGNQNIILVWTSEDPDGPGGCPPLMLDTIVQVFGPATADITSLLNVCDNEELQLTVTSNTNTGTWFTQEGTGTIDDATENSTTYTPSNTDYQQSPIEFFFIIPDPDGNGPCEGVSDSIEVEVNLAPTAYAGIDDTICSGGILPQLVGTPGGGIWTGSANASGQFVGSGIGIFESFYTYSDSEGCVDADTVVVNVFPTATASAGGPYPICGLQPVVLNAGTNGTGQWTGGQGTYSLNTDVGATYTPDASEIGFLVPITWTTNDPDGVNGPCAAASATAIVAISEPAATQPTTPITICSSDTADLAVNTTPANGTWSGGSGTFLDANSPTTIYIPTIADVGNIVLTWETTDPDDVAPDSIGPCPSVEVDQIVFVLDAATADAGSDIYSCGLDSIALNATANGIGEWSGGVGSFNNSSQTDTYYHPDPSEVGQSFELYWTTFDPDLTATDNGPCTGDIDTVVVQINTPAFAEIADIDPICSNGDATLSVTSYPAQGTWDGGAGQYAADNQLSTTYTPAATETAIVIPITWTTIDPDGTGPTGPCEPYQAEAMIDILAEAIANITSTYSVCANGTLDISVQENGDGEWTVDPLTAGTFTDSSMSTTQFIPSVDYYTAQTIEIKWATFDPDGTGPCLSALDSTTVNTLPLPQITMAPSFSIPCGDDISATVLTYQNVSYTFSWSPEDGLIEPDQLTTPAVGDDDYALQVIDANGCVNADTTTVDAIALANMASAADASTCLYVPIQLTGSAADGQGPFTYNWVTTEEVTPSALDNTLADFVFDDYILQDSILNIEFEVSDLYGCTDDTIISVTVFALPAIDPGQDWGLCEDSPVFTLANFSPQPNMGISGVWTPSDVVDPAQIGVDAVTYTYTFTDNNGCVNDSSMVVSINEVPEAVMVIPGVACVETPLPLENNTTCGTCSNVEYEWDFGIANSTSNEFEPSFIYSVNDIGLQTVQLVAISGFGCDDTTTAVVDIVLPPVPLFEATYNLPSCAPLAVDIAHNTDTTGLYLSYEWTVEDITQNNIVGVYNTFLPPPIVLQQGDSILDYSITLMVSNVCGNYDTDTIVNVLPQPVADILTSTVYGCTPLVVDFINSSVGLPDDIEWDFGDGTFSGMDTPPPHTFYTDSTITIYSLVVALENECGVDTFFQDITVLPNTVNALFVTSTAAGCTPLEVTFNDFSTGASQLNFSLCNGATFSGETFTYTFTEPGDCVVELVADNGCSYDTTSVSIFVVQSPEPTIVADNSYCANEPIEFMAENALDAMLTWNFDDGSPQTTGNPAEHAYTDAGDYMVELHAENNLFGVQCEGTATLPVHISPNPQAAFTIPTNFGCSPFDLCFTNLSSTSDPNMILSQQWNFDGLNVDTDFAPCHIYTNQTGELVYYTVTLEVTAADIQYMQTCTSSTSQNILVLPQPISSFEMADPYTCYFPYELATTNTTVGGGAYQWIFNGQDWSQQTNATFPIDDLGAYDIDLIATNQFGCTDTSQQVFNSYPLPTLDFAVDFNDGCDPLRVQFDNLSTGNNNYTWLFDDGTEATLQDVVHEYTNPGAYNVMLVGTTENNCSDTLAIEDPILVYPVPVANFIFAPVEVNILNPQMTFEETGFGGSFFHWDFNDGAEDVGAIVDHRFNTPYYHAVTLTAFNQYGCSDEITKSVFVTDALTVFVPNAFTPDDDNINDQFRPEMGGKEMIDTYKFWITDRWGVVLFTTNDFDEPWLGNINGGDHYVSPDVYIWNIEVQLKSGEEREYNGHVTIVR